MKKNLLVAFLFVCGISKAAFDVHLSIINDNGHAQDICPQSCKFYNAKWTGHWTNKYQGRNESVCNCETE